MNPRSAAIPWPWRAAAWIATAAAGIVLALVLAHWGWRMFGPPSVPLAPLATPDRWAPAIASAPIFGRAGAPVASVPANPVAMGGDARLLGVFAERGGTGYALFRLPTGPVLVRSGQDVAQDVRLEAVNRDGVRLRDHGEVRDVALRVAPAATAAPSDKAKAQGPIARTACTPPAGYQGPVYRVNAELLTGIGSQPDSWKALLVASEGGLAVRDDSGFSAMLGMRAGDRMTQANGIALASVDDIMLAVVKPLVANQTVRVSGTRAGKPAEWLFVNASACS
jgi:hypothetical protein